jgi:hypothetical protein
MSNLCEADPLSDPVLYIGAIGFDHSSCSFETHDGRQGDWEVESCDPHPVGRVDGGGIDSDEELSLLGLGFGIVLVGWVLAVFVENETFLGGHRKTVRYFIG